MIQVKIQCHTKLNFQSILRSSGMAQWFERLAQSLKIMGSNLNHTGAHAV